MENDKKTKRYSEETWMKAWNNRRFVYSIATKMTKRYPQIHADDLLSVGLEGLCKGYESMSEKYSKKETTKYLANAIRFALITEINKINGYVPYQKKIHGSGVSYEYFDFDIAEHCCDNEYEENVFIMLVILDKAISVTLTEKQRNSIVSFFGIGNPRVSESISEIAKRMKVSRKMIYKNIEHSKKKIKRYVEENRNNGSKS